MKLIKLKLRGLGSTPVTNWCDLAPGMNLFTIPDTVARSAFIDAAQTINPPYDCRIVRPFRDFPTSVNQNGYTRHIQPHKRTIAIGVFSTSPNLVEILAVISSHFYEMDRLEVGRRLDYSRWLNYVELASSTRWSEVSEEMWSLFRRWGDDDPGIYRLLQGFAPTDRITGRVMVQLADWIESMSSQMVGNENEQFGDLLTDVKRGGLFARAKKVTEGFLPYFFSIDLSQPISPYYRLSDENSLSFLLKTYLQRSLHSLASSEPDDQQVARECNRALEQYCLGLPIRVEADKGTYRIHHAGKIWVPSARGSSPEDLMTYVTLLDGLHRAHFSTSPVLLIHDGNDSRQKLHGIDTALLELSSLCQCLYFPRDPSYADGFPKARRHDWAKLLGAGTPN